MENINTSNNLENEEYKKKDNLDENKLLESIHDKINELRDLVKNIKTCTNFHLYKKSIKELELFKKEYEDNINKRCKEIDYIISIKKDKYSEFDNEISPACGINKAVWYNGLLEYNHKIESSEKKNNLFTSLDPLPEPFIVRVKIVKADNPGYSILGVTNRFYHEDMHYLGDKCTGEGSLGFGTTGLCGCEGKYQSYSGSHLKTGDVLTIHGDYLKVSFSINNELRFSYTFKERQNALYLAGNCYFCDIFEILESEDYDEAEEPKNDF